MGARELFPEQDIGVGGGAREPVVRFGARVERGALVSVREADERCAS